MSIYSVFIGEREYQVNISGNQMSVDGEPMQSNLVPLNGNGLHLLRRGHQNVELHLNAQNLSTYEVLVGGRRVIAHVDPAHRRARRRREAHSAGDLIAPMPGLVVEVCVREGDAVGQGQVLAVLESMKMQMQLRAPFAGRVACVAAQLGGQVDKGALLVRIVE